MSMNKVMIVGYVGGDPEVRSLGNDQKVARMRVATSERWKDRNTGEQKEKTDWHTIVVFNQGLVKVIENYVKKGTLIGIDGKLETREWQDKDQNKRTSVEIVLRNNGELRLLGPKPGGDRREGSADTRTGNGGARSQPRQDDALPDNFGGVDDFYDTKDEVPF